MEVKIQRPSTPTYKVLFPSTDIYETSSYDQTMFHLNSFFDNNFVYTTPQLNKQRPKSSFLLKKFPIEKKIDVSKKVDKFSSLKLLHKNTRTKFKRSMSVCNISLKKRYNNFRNIFSSRSKDNRKNSSIELKPNKRSVYSKILKNTNIKNNLSSFESTKNSSHKKYFLKKNKSNNGLSTILKNNNSSIISNKNKNFSINSSVISKKSKKNSSIENNNLNLSHRGSVSLIYNIGLTKQANLEIRKIFHNKIFLDNLKRKVSNYEHSKNFIPNDKKIKENVLQTSKFQRNVFNKKVKSAFKNNNYFYKTRIHKSNQSEHNIINKNKGIKKIIKSQSGRILLKQVNKAKQRAITGLNTIINQKNSTVGSNNIYNVMKLVVPKAKTSLDMDNEEFKDEVLNYKKKVGNFFYYRGCGIFQEHLHAILKGDRLIQELVKYENK